MGYQPVRYRKVFLDDEDVDDPNERGRGREDKDSDEASSNRRHKGDAPGAQRSDEGDRGDDPHGSDDGYHYSDDHENYSDDSESNTHQPEATGWCQQTFKNWWRELSIAGVWFVAASLTLAGVLDPGGGLRVRVTHI